MRVIIGIILALLITLGSALVVFAIWGVSPISWLTIWRFGLSILIVAVVVVLLWLVKIMFFDRSITKQGNNK